MPKRPFLSGPRDAMKNKAMRREEFPAPMDTVVP